MPLLRTLAARTPVSRVVTDSADVGADRAKLRPLMVAGADPTRTR